MIVEIVKFNLPDGTTRTDALALYRKSAPQWLANRDLVQKYYYFDPDRCVGGGVYIWPSREAAERWHGEDYRKMVRALYGAEPQIEILDALIHVDPSVSELTELSA